MPRKRTSKYRDARRSAQARKATPRSQLQKLKDAISDVRAKEAERLKHNREYRKARATYDKLKTKRDKQSIKLAKKARVERDRELKREIAFRRAEHKDKLDILRALGIYNPKGSRLTPTKRRKIDDTYAQYQKLLNPDDFIMIPLPKSVRASRKATDEFKRKARGSAFDVFDNVLFYGRQGVDKAKLVYDKSIEAWTVEGKRISRVINPRTGKERIFKSRKVVPVVGFDTLDQRKQGLRELGDRIKRQGGGTITFTIGGNASRASFETMDQLLSHTDYYGKTTDAYIDFLDQLEVHIVSYDDVDDDLLEGFDDGDYLATYYKPRNRKWTKRRKRRK